MFTLPEFQKPVFVLPEFQKPVLPATAGLKTPPAFPPPVLKSPEFAKPVLELAGVPEAEFPGGGVAEAGVERT